MLRGGLDCSLELLPTADGRGCGRTRRPDKQTHTKVCHGVGQVHKDVERRERETWGALSTPEELVHGVVLRRMARARRGGLVAWSGHGCGQKSAGMEGYI